MSLNYISEKLSLNNAESFKDSFSQINASIEYVFIGNHVPYANDLSPDSIVETISTEKIIWDNMFAAKRVTANDVELVIPRVNWTSNTKYKQYDDKIQLSELITGNTLQNLKPFYTITSGLNVYKCLSNNFSANSTVEPVGDYSTSNGVISTADGYTWKYMFNVKSSNKFLNAGWIPTPVRNPLASTLTDYNLDDSSIVEGELTTVVIENGGTGYYDSEIFATTYDVGCTVLTVANTSNIKINMSVSGTGIPSGTIITGLDTPNNKITISTPTTSEGGGLSGNLSISTRVYFDGDGTGAEGITTLSNGSISKITITTIGTGYSRSNVFIYGSGTGASARVIIAPKYGHSKNPAKDLLAKNVMISSQIGQVDSTENGLISTKTSLRQYGLLRNPHKYGQAEKVTNNTANSVISQVTTVTLLTGPQYSLNEYVYQASGNNIVAYGFVYSQSETEVKLTKVKGSFIAGLLLVGEISGSSRVVVGSRNPEFEPYSGDILYVENTTKIDRQDGQAENIKFVIQF